MRIAVSPISENPLTLLRRAGYVFQREEGGEMSFIRAFGRSGYPRFHCYTALAGTALRVNLHLDQKKHTYGPATRHHGEYEDSGPVREEAGRLLALWGEAARLVE